MLLNLPVEKCCFSYKSFGCLTLLFSTSSFFFLEIGSSCLCVCSFFVVVVVVVFGCFVYLCVPFVLESEHRCHDRSVEQMPRKENCASEEKRNEGRGEVHIGEIGLQQRCRMADLKTGNDRVGLDPRSVSFVSPKKKKTHFFFFGTSASFFFSTSPCFSLSLFIFSPSLLLFSNTTRKGYSSFFFWFHKRLRSGGCRLFPLRLLRRDGHIGISYRLHPLFLCPSKLFLLSFFFFFYSLYSLPLFLPRFSCL